MNPLLAHQVKRTIEAALAHGGCIAIFPEATTTDGITVRPFHSGLFESAVVSGATVWPVALRYYHSDGSLSKEAAFIGDQSLISSLRRILRQPVLNLAVSFGSPIAADGWERQELATAVYRAVTDMLKGQGQLMHPELVLPVSTYPRSNWRSFPSLCPNLPSLAVRLRQYPETATHHDSGLPKAHLFLTILAADSARF
jgi:1-acyl-sn-glycerol-3-phosphate acyltransferase